MRLPLTGRRGALLLAALLAAGPARAAAPEGLWLTEDREGVIEIRACAAGLCGRIVGTSETTRPDGSVPSDSEGHPMCRLTILRVGPDGPNQWSGLVTDPRDNTDWHCTLRLDAAGNLRLRGYVLLPLLGHTETWTRFTGRTGSDCAIIR